MVGDLVVPDLEANIQAGNYHVETQHMVIHKVLRVYNPPDDVEPKSGNCPLCCDTCKTAEGWRSGSRYWKLVKAAK